MKGAEQPSPASRGTWTSAESKPPNPNCSGPHPVMQLADLVNTDVWCSLISRGCRVYPYLSNNVYGTQACKGTGIRVYENPNSNTKYGDNIHLTQGRDYTSAMEEETQMPDAEFCILLIHDWTRS
jgi:hypothetical protein